MPSIICWIPKRSGILAKGIEDFDLTCRNVNIPVTMSMAPDVKLAFAEKHMSGLDKIYKKIRNLR